jgi:hypothetical protein
MWLFDQTGLRKQELKTGSKLRSAIETARGVSLRDRRYLLQLVNSHSDHLSAVNPKARIEWGRLICRELSDHFHLRRHKLEPDRPVFLVTLCDRRCCTSHQEKNIDVPRLIRTLRRGMRGLSYVGMLEPAFYVNMCKGTHVQGKRMVSWHLHLIAWGESHKKLRKRIGRLNDQRLLLPIADGLPAAHQKRISKDKLASKIGYVLKAPKKAYRLYKWEMVSPDGETIPRFKQWKDDLRPGERLTLLRLMQDLYLDQLAVAGGEGTATLRRVKRRVLQEIPE